MLYKNNLIKYFEVLIIIFSLIIILLYESNSQKYFYFITIYIVFLSLFFKENIKNIARIILLILMYIFIFKSSTSNNSKYYFGDQNFVEFFFLILILLFSINCIILNLQIIKKFKLTKIFQNILNLNIKLIIKYFSIVLIFIFIIEIFLNIFLPKNYTNIIPNKHYGNYYYNFPYRHEHYQFIGKGNASNVKTTHRHVTRSGNAYSINYSTNNKGFRIPFDIDISKKYVKEKNEIVILLIGGSTALGVGASDNNTISSILKNKLNNNFSDYKFTVLNFGIGAANAYQEFLVLDLYGNNFDPDWVISLTGRNDGYNALTTNSGAGTTNGFLKTKEIVDGLYYNQPIPKLHHSKLSNYFAKYSKLYRITTGSSHITLNEKEDIKFEETFKTLNFYLKSLNNIISYSNNIKFIISNQPYYNLIVNNNFKKINNLFEFEKKHNNKAHPYIDKFLWMEYWNAKSSLETKNYVKNLKNVFYVDFNKEFSELKNLDDIYIDSTHLTKYGNEIVAQNYFNIISKNFK